MSRGRLPNFSEVCADCGASDPKWASTNRGVLVCDECCSVHRSLGRHISQVKSLKRGSWSPTFLAMIHQLVSLGANNIWEHSLLDPSQNKQGRRKPNPQDPLHPTKADFIRAKYQFLAFSKKAKDEEKFNSVEDLSRQLHSSVRTGNLETSLRLLSLGANPNFFHPEKNNCPLHVTAQAGQISQVELLVTYGGDPGAMDGLGKTPVAYARAEGHHDLADRLAELQYELTDRLAYYLCGRKPDHRSGQHYIIPEMADSSLDLSELAKAAKKKLQALPNPLFEELAMDVYDEVDRREVDAVWLSTQNHSTLVSDRQSVPFLPVNPEFTSTRNQGRQKLARFNAREFTTLVIDILSDAKRRQLGVSSSTPQSQKDSRIDILRTPKRIVKTNSLSDDEPLYDSVASDEDYSSLSELQGIKPDTIKEEPVKKEEDKAVNVEESLQEEQNENPPISVDDFLGVKKSLVASEAKVQQLFQTNKDLRQEVMLLRSTVHKLAQENEALRSTSALSSNTHIQESLPQEGIQIRRSASNARPQSMYEPRNHERHPSWTQHMAPFREDTLVNYSSQDTQRLAETVQADKDHLSTKYLDQQSDDVSDYDNNGLQDVLSDRATLTPGTPPELSDGAAGDGNGSVALPSQEEVVKKTEKITKKIQELLALAQANKLDSYGPCSEKINAAVNDMAALFPERPGNQKIEDAVQLLTGGAVRLKEECNGPPVETTGKPDFRLKTQQVIQCAYDIAKAAKQLVTLFEIK